MAGKMKIIDRTGHSTVLWETEADEAGSEVDGQKVLSQDEVNAEFDRMTAMNYPVYKRPRGERDLVMERYRVNDKGEVIDRPKFDPEAEEYLLSPQMQGGLL